MGGREQKGGNCLERLAEDVYEADTHIHTHTRTYTYTHM